MSLNSKPGGTKSNMNGFQKLFDSTTCSDFKILFPSPANSAIHTHRVVLAAGSRYFYRQFREADGKGSKLVDWQGDDNDGYEAMRTAVQYMYGLKLPLGNDVESFYSLRRYAEVSRIAEKYEINGLYDSIFKAASRAVADALKSPEALQEILNDGAFQTPTTAEGVYGSSFVVRVIRDNLTALHREKEFRRLLKSQPKLAAVLLNFLVDEKNGLKTSNDIDFGAYEEFDQRDPEMVQE